MFGVLAAVAAWLGQFHTMTRFHAEQETLAIWFDGLTFLCSALLISRLRLSNGARSSTERPGVAQTWRDIIEGLKFIRGHSLVRGVMIGLAGGLLGAGLIVPLGAVVAKELLGGTPSAFGFLETALGVGAAIGVVTLAVVAETTPARTGVHDRGCRDGDDRHPGRECRRPLRWRFSSLRASARQPGART